MSLLNPALLWFVFGYILIYEYILGDQGPQPYLMSIPYYLLPFGVHSILFIWPVKKGELVIS